MMHESRYFLVSGRVQGVCFRAATRDMARALGLRGWVRNRNDGDVEGEATGHATALSEFRDWLGRGPAAARVDRVVFDATRVDDPGATFAIR